MKRFFLILSLAAFVLSGCDIVEFGEKAPQPEEPARDEVLTGTAVDVTGLPGDLRKVFVLNEGGMGSNNASLDFLRISDGSYVTGAFRKMNPAVGAGLGDVGNDIAVLGDEVWVVVNNSGLVEVLSAVDETEIAVIPIPTPRNIAFDDKYAYVTSWAGAYATYGSDYSIVDYKNPRGYVYRINLATHSLDSFVQVGYQPEGVACQDGKLYVANSGGLTLPPTYSYDNTVSVIDTKSFTVTKTLDVQVNLKTVYADGAGNVYVTALGDYWSTHSGLYMIGPGDAVKHVSDYVSVSSLRDGVVYCIGTPDEFDWSGAPKTWKAWSCRNGVKSDLSWAVDATTPYGLYAFSGDTFLLGDAGDYFNPGTVSLYGAGARKWSVTAGVCPGHIAIW